MGKAKKVETEPDVVSFADMTMAEKRIHLEGRKLSTLSDEEKKFVFGKVYKEGSVKQWKPLRLNDIENAMESWLIVDDRTAKERQKAII